MVIQKKGEMGAHFLLDLYGVDAAIIQNSNYLKKALKKAATECGFTILGELFYEFKPQGFTGILLLSESHFSFHTWPERSSVAVDVFSCGSAAKAKKLCDAVIDFTKSKSSKLKILKR